jgi:hypothetical protein
VEDLASPVEPTSKKGSFLSGEISDLRGLMEMFTGFRLCQTRRDI